MTHSYSALAVMLLVLGLLFQVLWIVLLFLGTLLAIYREPKEEKPSLWRLFKYYARMPWYQIWIFLVGGAFEPSLYYRVKLTYYLFRDELFINEDEFHYSLNSFCSSATEGFYPLLWVKFLLDKRKEKDHKESFGDYLLTRYQERLCIRREIAHETDSIKGSDGFFIRQRLWYAYRINGRKKYYGLKHVLVSD